MESFARNDAEPDRIQQICSLLIANGYVAKGEFPELLHDDELRRGVENRLDSVGMKLITNQRSKAWAVALNERTSADDRLEWSTNFGLDRGALALLLILWCKLALPDRMAGENEIKDGDFLAPVIPTDNIADAPLRVSRDQIIAEFSDMLGGASAIAKYLGQLARANLIRNYGGFIQEGPLMSCIIDEDALSDDLNREVLINVLKREKKSSRS